MKTEKTPFRDSDIADVAEAFRPPCMAQPLSRRTARDRLPRMRSTCGPFARSARRQIQPGRAREGSALSEGRSGRAGGTYHRLPSAPATTAAPEAELPRRRRGAACCAPSLLCKCSGGLHLRRAEAAFLGATHGRLPRLFAPPISTRRDRGGSAPSEGRLGGRVGRTIGCYQRLLPNGRTAIGAPLTPPPTGTAALSPSPQATSSG
jgi:hypothetical protein